MIMRCETAKARLSQVVARRCHTGTYGVFIQKFVFSQPSTAWLSMYTAFARSPFSKLATKQAQDI